MKLGKDLNVAWYDKSSRSNDKTMEFGAISAVSDATSFKNWIDTVKGTITLRQKGDTLRCP